MQKYNSHLTFYLDAFKHWSIIQVSFKWCEDVWTRCVATVTHFVPCVSFHTSFYNSSKKNVSAQITISQQFDWLAARRTCSTLPRCHNVKARGKLCLPIVCNKVLIIVNVAVILPIKCHTHNNISQDQLLLFINTSVFVICHPSRPPVFIKDNNNTNKSLPPRNFWLTRLTDQRGNNSRRLWRLCRSVLHMCAHDCALNTLHNAAVLQASAV